MSIARQWISKKAFSTIEAVFSAWSVLRVYKGTKNWVEFWRWQSKVIEKK
jgi:hypothetical protein